MFGKSPQEIMLLVGAFQVAWLSLLNDERVTSTNIDHLPSLLMSAILEAAWSGERDEQQLATAGLRQLDAYESEISAALRAHPN
jgi:hypothetical protein